VLHRFDPDINQLRAALRGRRGDDLLAALGPPLANLRAAALVADDTRRYVAANALAEQLTGYTADELTRLRLDDITPLPRAADARGLWRDFIAKGTQQGEFELRCRTGSSVRVRYWAYANVAPGIHVSILVRVDSA
jgi:PAS domain S-box-containing protein